MGFGKVLFKFGQKMIKYGTKLEKYGAKSINTKATKLAAPIPLVKTPTLSEQVAKLPKGLPAPTAQQILSTKPKVNTGKALGLNLDELNMSQVITKDGTHVKYYRRAGSNEILLKTEDKGLAHTETIYNYKNSDNKIIIKDNGVETRITHATPNSTQIYTTKPVYKDGITQNVTEDIFIMNQGNSNFYDKITHGTNGTINRTRSVAVTKTHRWNNGTVSDMSYKATGTSTGRDSLRSSAVADIVRDVKSNPHIYSDSEKMTEIQQIEAAAKGLKIDLLDLLKPYTA